jgi:hypothetical protein
MGVKLGLAHYEQNRLKVLEKVLRKVYGVSERGSERRLEKIT